MVVLVIPSIIICALDGILLSAKCFDPVSIIASRSDLPHNRRSVIFPIKWGPTLFVFERFIVTDIHQRKNDGVNRRPKVNFVDAGLPPRTDPTERVRLGARNDFDRLDWATATKQEIIVQTNTFLSFPVRRD